ncbi:MAG: hypothetical protein RBT49_00765 [Bacteroidales bacterium]|jgi:hypothetical protein|nr:hypothetical protein [Bacteroidales bacterium]
MIKKLFFEIGGYFSDHHKIEIKGNKGLYNKTSSGPYFLNPEEFEIDSEKMEQLIQILNVIDVWSWEREYFNSEVMDGTHWQLEIVLLDGKRVKSEGSNKYPGSEGIEFSDKFLKLIRAFELIGRIKISEI